MRALQSRPFRLLRSPLPGRSNSALSASRGLKLRRFSTADPYLPEIVTKRGMGKHYLLKAVVVAQFFYVCSLSDVEVSPVLVRDFIHDSLYNPEYGYFSKNEVIYSSPEPLNFQELEGIRALHRSLFLFLSSLLISSSLVIQVKRITFRHLAVSTRRTTSDG